MTAFFRIKALKWFIVANAGGSVDQKPLPNMMRVMEQTATPVQVTQAQKLASQWWPLCQEIAA